MLVDVVRVRRTRVPRVNEGVDLSSYLWSAIARRLSWLGTR